MQRLLICGFGDIARRAAPALQTRFEMRSWGESDARTANLLAALEKGRILPARIEYVSTSGVYGHRGGESGDESGAPGIYAADLAAAVVRSLEPEAPSRVYNAAGDTERLMMKHQLGVRLGYPTVHEGLRHADALGVH